MQWVDGKLLIIGSGPLERELKKITSELRLEERITFLGEQEQGALASYYHACDVFVLPSTHRSEMFGLVQLEAMACGRPVVSTSLPTGVSWVNQDGMTGLLVPPADPRALAGAMTRLLDDRSLRERLGADGRRRVEAEFTKKKMGARVLELYREILL
jgi:rhamnosyl/mannosyltransferase